MVEGEGERERTEKKKKRKRVSSFGKLNSNCDPDWR